MTVLPWLVGATSLTLVWQPPPFEGINGVIEQYVIQINEVNTGRMLTATSDTTNITVENLHPFYSYNCRVAAETIEVGPYSSPIRVQLNEDGRQFSYIDVELPMNVRFTLVCTIVPSAPPIVNSYYAIDPTTLYLSWTAPPLDKQNGIIRSYSILLTELETESTFIYTSTNINHTITLLHPYYQYQIEVSAITIGAGPTSTPVVLQMPEDGKNSSKQQYYA